MPVCVYKLPKIHGASLLCINIIYHGFITNITIHSHPVTIIYLFLISIGQNLSAIQAPCSIADQGTLRAPGTHPAHASPEWLGRISFTWQPGELPTYCQVSLCLCQGQTLARTSWHCKYWGYFYAYPTQRLRLYSTSSIPGIYTNRKILASSPLRNNTVL